MGQSTNRHLHEIRLGGQALLCGDETSIAVIEGNLDGRNFATPRPGHDQTHEQWLAYMAQSLGHALPISEPYCVVEIATQAVRRSGRIGLGLLLAGKHVMLGGVERCEAREVAGRIADGEQGDDLPIVMEAFGCDYERACELIFSKQRDDALALFADAVSRLAEASSPDTARRCDVPRAG